MMRRSAPPKQRRAFVALLVLAVVPAGIGVGCGGEEKQFTAEGFIDAMNENGATLSLGPVLTTNPDGIDVREVDFAEVAPSATGDGAQTEGDNGGATLLVFGGADDAKEEFARCDTAAALTCFRAANAVLRVENLQPSDRARITTAIEAVGAAG